MNILFEDKDIIVIIKPSGVDSQSSVGLSKDMVSIIKNHLDKDNVKEPYVGVIHRLDKPVSGVMVFAKNKNAAAFLSSELASGHINKKYSAIICGTPDGKSGEFEDYLLNERSTNCVRVVDKNVKGAKDARLKYKVIKKKYIEGVQLTKVEVELITGRHHQIRVQFAAHNLPLLGDRKYNPLYSDKEKQRVSQKDNGIINQKNIALASIFLEFVHPKTKKKMMFRYEPDDEIWNQF